MEPEEGLEKVQDALHVCQSYQTTYHDHRTNMGQYFKEGPPVEWQFQPSLVFARLDSFMGQLTNIQVSVGGVQRTQSEILLVQSYMRELSPLTLGYGSQVILSLGTNCHKHVAYLV